IPVDLKFDAKVFTLSSREKLLVTKDFCILVQKGTLALSPDCLNYAYIRDGRVLKRLFKMKRGSVSVGLGIDKKGIKIPILIQQH
ncbi:hypothetical protein KJ865_17040, partial [Myxococcota bacterium]|nr:hypothetical protein [Myxococcota bacterium]